MGYILYIVGLLGSIACWIMVLIKMFKTEKPLIGVLGILCSLWAFIWGWMNAGKQGLQKIMLIWTVCIVLAGVGGGMSGAALARMQPTTSSAP